MRRYYCQGRTLPCATWSRVLRQRSVKFSATNYHESVRASRFDNYHELAFYSAPHPFELHLRLLDKPYSQHSHVAHPGLALFNTPGAHKLGVQGKRARAVRAKQRRGPDNATLRRLYAGQAGDGRAGPCANDSRGCCQVGTPP